MVYFPACVALHAKLQFYRCPEILSVCHVRSQLIFLLQMNVWANLVAVVLIHLHHWAQHMKSFSSACLHAYLITQVEPRLRSSVKAQQLVAFGSFDHASIASLRRSLPCTETDLSDHAQVYSDAEI